MTTAVNEPADNTTTAEDSEVEQEPAAGREAAKYRRQLREAETERDTLRGRLETMQRTEVERIARTEHNLTKPAAIWSAGTDLADLLADDGKVDPVKVKEATEAAISTLGLAVNRPVKPDHSQGPRGGVPVNANTWATLLSTKGHVGPA